MMFELKLATQEEVCVSHTEKPLLQQDEESVGSVCDDDSGTEQNEITSRGEGGVKEEDSASGEDSVSEEDSTSEEGEKEDSEIEDIDEEGSEFEGEADIEVTYLSKRIGNEFRENIEAASCLFAVHGYSEDAPNPGIILEGHGMIGFPFPMSQHDINAIERAGETHPPDQISTVPALKLEIHNPKWSSYIKLVIEKVSLTMGLTAAGSKVEAKLLALLLYKPREDNGSIPENTLIALGFGFLDIILPSKHGDHVSSVGEQRGHFFSYNTEEKRCLASESEYDCSYAAWFKEVTANSLGPTSRHQIVLRYSLEQSNQAVTCSAARIIKARSKLRTLFNNWHMWRESKEDYLKDGSLGDTEYGVERQYTKADFALGYMLDQHYSLDDVREKKYGKNDARIIDLLEKSLDEAEFYLCTAAVEREMRHKWKVGGRYVVQHHSIKSKTLSNFTAPNGIQPFEKVRRSPCDEFVHIINRRDDLDSSGTAQMEYDQFLANARPRNVLIIIPRMSCMAFFLGHNPSSKSNQITAEAILENSTRSEANMLNGSIRRDVTNDCDETVHEKSWKILRSGHD